MRGNLEAYARSTWILIQRRLLEEARKEWEDHLRGIVVGGRVVGPVISGPIPPDTLPIAYTTINFIVDGGGDTITTGSKGFLISDIAGTILSATLLADVTGSAVVDIKKATYSSFPTLVSITASAKPTLSTAQKSQDSVLTGWIKTINAGDVFEFIVESATNVTRLTVSLAVRRTQ